MAYAGLAAVPTDVWALLALFALAGIAIGLVETAEHAAVAALAPPQARGSAFGLLAFVQAGGNLAASVVAGILWTVVSAGAAFSYLAGWMALALIATVAVRRG